MPFRNPIVNELIVGSPSTGGIDIGSTVPAVLVAFYSAKYPGSFIVKAWIGMYADANNYYYRIILGGVIFGFPLHAEGFVANGAVVELRQINPDPSTGGTSLSEEYGEATANWFIGYNGGQMNYFDVEEVDRPEFIARTRGYYDGVNITSGALTTAGAAETDIPQAALSVAFLEANRRYRITAYIALNMTVATDQWELRCRLFPALTGTVIGESDGFGGVGLVSCLIDFIYTPSADASTVFCFSHQRRTGTGTLQAFGSPGGGIARSMACIQHVGGGSVANQWRTA